MHDDVVRENLRKVEERLKWAAQSCGREPEEITLLPVTKGQPLEHLQSLYRLGLRQFGESRVQELLAKTAWAPADVRWHFIGHLQENKINKVLQHVSLLQSVDSLKLARALEGRAARAKLRLDVLLEVNTSREPSKGGVAPEAAEEVYYELAEFSHLRPRGLMTLAPLTDKTQVVRQSFRSLHSLYESLQSCVVAPSILSMGMSQDLEMAIQEGSTMVRVGRALLGKRG